MELTEWDLTVAEKLEALYHSCDVYGKAPNRYKEIRGVNADMVFYGKHRDNQAGRINLYDIFKTKEEYINKELEWYMSQSLDAKWIGQHAKIWLDCCDENSKINSNYGYLMFSAQNGYQFKNVIKELTTDKDSRRAVAYYANPFIHYTGGKDYICTIAVQYLFRNKTVDAIVYMRSNDIVYGLIGADLFWQNECLKLVCDLLTIHYCEQIFPGDIHWMPGSLHIYERHWIKLNEFIKEMDKHWTRLEEQL